MRDCSRFTAIGKLSALVCSMLVWSCSAFAQVSPSPIGYVRSDGVNAVVYQGPDRHIYELALYPGGWDRTDLTTLAGAPLVLSDVDVPAPYVRSDGVSAVVYRGPDYEIFELELLADGWHVQNLLRPSGFPVAISSPRGYVRSDGFNAVVYVGYGDHVYEFALYADGWHLGDLSAQFGAPSAGPPNVWPYVRSDGFNAVVYFGAARHIYELGLYGDGWHAQDLTAYAGAPSAYSRTVPYVRSDGFNAVLYYDRDGHIYELGLYGDGWHAQDLTAYAGAPLAYFDGGPAPYVRSDGFNAVVYNGLNDGHVYELSLYADGWRAGDLSALSGAPPARLNCPPAPYVRSDGFNVVVYAGNDGHIYELALYPDGWYVGDLTAAAGG
jgi:hypothetical protein